MSSSAANPTATSAALMKNNWTGEIKDIFLKKCTYLTFKVFLIQNWILKIVEEVTFMIVTSEGLEEFTALLS